MIGTVNNEGAEMNASELILRAIEVVAVLIAVGLGTEGLEGGGAKAPPSPTLPADSIHLADK